MTVDKLHDAIGLLPAELVAETDALRQRPHRRKAAFPRWLAGAACLGLFLGLGWLAFPREKTASSAADTALQAQAEAETVSGTGRTSDHTAPESASTHSHAPATGNQKTAEDVGGYCGNTSATVYVGDEHYTLWGDDAIALTDLLLNLDYDPEAVCDCPGEYEAETELQVRYEISLTGYFVRCRDGQAALTEEEAETIRQILTQLDILS